MTPQHNRGVLALFASHPVAANLLMLIMLISGGWALSRLNTQFFPTFDVDFITVRTTWPGAGAEDVEQLITIPLEQGLEEVDFVKDLSSTSADSISSITLEFKSETDMGLALDQVKEKVALVTNLPSTAEQTEVIRIVRYEPIARLLVTGGNDISELRGWVRRFEQELLDRGIAKIFISGLPEEEIAIQISAGKLQALGLSLDGVARRLSDFSKDVPLGGIGRSHDSRQLRFKERRKQILDFASIPLVAENGRLIRLGDVAEVTRQQQKRQTTVFHHDQPAVELSLNRTTNSDSLEAAEIFHRWLEETRPQLPESIKLIPYAENWELLSDRIGLLLKNGLGGLVLVVIILFLFLHSRVAWWVAVGIPVSFMAALAVLYMLGGSIDMISLFGLIMALGIIVDDTIVVGEDAMTHYQQGEGAYESVLGGARRMLAPVFSSSLTTIAAFMPLLLVGGIIGTIMRAIPIVVICVIIASLLECFLVLPGHLRNAFTHIGHDGAGRLRRRLDEGFARFRTGLFRSLVVKSTNNPSIVIAIALSLLIMTVGLLSSGRLAFHFFPTGEPNRIFANINYVAGTPPAVVKQYLDKMERTLLETEEALGEPFIELVIKKHGAGINPDAANQSRGDQFGALRVQLTEPDERSVTNSEIIKAWRQKLPPEPGIENLSIFAPRGGPPGRDLDIRIIGGDSTQRAKQAALALGQVLRDIQGVSGVEDNMPYGREQMILKLTPLGLSLGLTVDTVAQQVRAAYEGVLIQELAEGRDDLEVRVRLPDRERDHLGSLAVLNIFLAGNDRAGGTLVPLTNVVTVETESGFETLRHSDGELAVTVIGDVDAAANNTNEVRANLEKNILPDLAGQFGVAFEFQGRQADQKETLGDMITGAMVAPLLMYLVLAWVFGSYGWPLLVMFIIPFGLVGAIWGHVLLGLDLSVLSFFGFFGLTGIVVNDSIILVVFYKHLREQGMAIREAVVEAASQRLRAVLLTSLTTIAGLTPLLFETSLQAQFLIPMAVSIAFGLMFATILVLFLVPALLVIYEQTWERFSTVLVNIAYK